MDEKQISVELISVLTDMYGSEMFVNLMDFCQGELRVLLWLAEERPPEERIPSAIAGALHVTRGRVTAALAALKRKGMVELAGSEVDRRRVVITLTEAGCRYMRERRTQAESFVAEFVKKIGQARAQQLIDTLSLTL